MLQTNLITFVGFVFTNTTLFLVSVFIITVVVVYFYIRSLKKIDLERKEAKVELALNKSKELADEFSKAIENSPVITDVSDSLSMFIPTKSIKGKVVNIDISDKDTAPLNKSKAVSVALSIRITREFSLSSKQFEDFVQLLFNNGVRLQFLTLTTSKEIRRAITFLHGSSTYLFCETKDPRKFLNTITTVCLERNNTRPYYKLNLERTNIAQNLSKDDLVDLFGKSKAPLYVLSQDGSFFVKDTLNGDVLWAYQN